MPPQIKEALDRCDWIAPVVREYVAALDGRSVSDDQIQALEKILGYENEIAQELKTIYPSFFEILAKYSVPGILEGHIECRELPQLPAKLLQVTNTSTPHVRDTYFLLQLQILFAWGFLHGVLPGGDLQGSLQGSQRRLLNVLASRHPHRAVAFCGELLGIDSLDNATNAEFLGSLRRTFPSLDPFSFSELRGQLAQVLEQGGLTRLIPALLIFGFGGEADSLPSAAFRASFGSTIDRLQQGYATLGGLEIDAEDRQALEYLVKIELQTLRIVNRTSKQRELEMRERGWTWNEPQFLWDVLDGLLGSETPGTINLVTVDFLARFCADHSLGKVAYQWLRALEQRGLLEPTRAFVAVNLRGDTEAPMDPHELWNSPNSCGKVFLLGVFAFDIADENSANEVARRWFNLIGDESGDRSDIASFLAARSEGAEGRVSRWWISGFTTTFLREHRYSDLIDFCIRALNIDSFASRGFFDRCRALTTPGHGFSGDAAFIFSCLLESLHEVGHMDAHIQLRKAMGVGDSDPVWSLSRFNELRDIDAHRAFHLVSALIPTIDTEQRLSEVESYLGPLLGFSSFRTATDHQLFGLLERLEKSFGVQGVLAINVLGTLSNTIGAIRGASDAIRMLEGILNASSTLEEDHVVREFEAFCGGFARLADWWRTNSQYTKIIRLVERLLVHQPSAKLFQLSDDEGALFSFDRFTRVRMIPLLATCYLHALMNLGRNEDAKTLVMKTWPDANWFRSVTDQVEGGAYMGLAAACLQCVAEDEPEYADSLLWDVCDYWRGRLNVLGQNRYDRLRMSEFTEQFRQELVRAGHSVVVDATSSWLIGHRRKKNLMHESCLSACSLLEKFRRGVSIPLQFGDALQAPDGWGLHTQLKRKALAEQQPVILDRHQASWSSEMYRRPHIRRISKRRPIEVKHEYSQLNAWDERRVFGETLGPRTGLLRTGFSVKGRLVWTLFARVEDRLEAIATDEGKSQVNDQNYITQAIQRFDARVDGILDFAENEFHTADLQERLRQLLQNESGRWAPLSFIDKRLLRFLERLPRLGRRLCSFLEIGDISQLVSISDPTKNDERQWIDFWELTLQCGFPAESIKGARVGELLDQAAEELLTSVQSVWNLEGIGELLKDLDELVLWVDEELHNIPVAFFKTVVKGKSKYICQTAPSIRSIVSPVLDLWMKDAETVRDANASAAELLSISWFENGTPSERAVECSLLGVFRKLATQLGATTRWRAATRDSIPSSTHRVMASVLRESETPIALAAICGHGLDSPHGVLLGDGVWTGAELWSPSPDSPDQIDVSGAHELGRIELLAILSCSIGRIKHSNTLDVSGFCTDLFVNGARSVFAGRWPLIAGEALALFESVAKNYLELRRFDDASCKLAPVMHTRGKAVNAARRAWAEGGCKTFGLYTACSMELFGLS